MCYCSCFVVFVYVYLCSLFYVLCRVCCLCLREFYVIVCCLVVC